MSTSQKVMLVGHHTPVIHGQSIQYVQLLEWSKSWEDIDIIQLNTVYAEARNELSGYSFGKVVRMWSYLIQMCWVALKMKPEVIVLSPAFQMGPFLKDSFFILAAKYICRTKVIGWVHMDPSRMDYDNKPKWFQRYVSWTVSKIDLMVSCAPSLAKGWPDFLKAVPVKSVCNGISDEAGFFQRTRSADECVKIGFLSAMDSEKGWRELFNVALKMCKANEGVEFHFYGDAGSGESEEDIKNVFLENPYEDRIVWHGGTWGEGKIRAYQEMDLYCFPSHTEAFPLSVLEAMSFSLPIVSTDVGAVKDAVIQDQGGWFCEKKNEESLRNALENALRYKDNWLGLGRFNRARFETNFSSQMFSDKWHDVFHEVMKLSGEN